MLIGSLKVITNEYENDILADKLLVRVAALL